MMENLTANFLLGLCEEGELTLLRKKCQRSFIKSLMRKLRNGRACRNFIRIKGNK